MKAVLLAPTPPPAGGIAGWTQRMLRAELPQGWALTVVDEKPAGSRQVFGKAGRRRITEEIGRCRRIWQDLKKVLRDEDALVVHSCIPAVTGAMMREYICGRITRARGRKFITHFRCTVPNTVSGKAGRFMLKRLCAVSDMIFALNAQSEEYLKKVTKTPVRVIPNFLSLQEIPEEHPVRENLETVLYVGGLTEGKGLTECLKIAEKMPDITFRFVGKGDDIFEKQAGQMNLNNVVFTGPKDHQGVREELEGADVFLFMTRFRGEGFSNALCEAMAAGLPCVATDWAANADMVLPGGGAIVPVGDWEGAAGAIAAMRDADTRRQMAAFNREKVQENYTEDIVVRKYFKAYEEVLNLGGSYQA